MKRRDFLAAPLAIPALGNSWVTARPRLFYNRARIQALRARLQRDTSLAAGWRLFLQHADQLLAAELISEADAQHGPGDDANFGKPSQQVVDMAFTLGLAYHVTQREPYAARLREALLHYAAYSSWHGPGFSKRVPPWHSELNTARFCVGMGAGYDALYSTLSSLDRHTITAAIARMGILATLEDWLEPETRIHALDSMGHNWWAVCVSSAGVAALSLLGDDPRVPQWLDRINEGIAQWFSYRGNVLQNKSPTFDSAGAFYESVGYANYAIFEYLRFRLAHTNVFPGRKQPDFAPLDKICEFFCQTFYPSSIAPLTVNFGDSSLHLQLSLTIRLLIENGITHSGAGWYIEKSKRSAFLTPQALEFLFHKPVPEPRRPPLPESILYSDIGWAILRDSWKDDATMLAVKSGFTWNHAHADAGSFVLFHAGMPLLIDSGTCGYGNPEYTRYYVQSAAHNVILFNGQGEPAEDHYRGVKFPGKLHSLIDDLGVKYLFADATGPMAQNFIRNYRHWLWLDGVILIIDDLLTYKEGTFDWLLHYAGIAAPQSYGVRITNGVACADVHFIYPETPDVHQEQGLAEHRPETIIPYFAFRTRRPARVQKFIIAIVPHPRQPGDEIPSLQLLQGSDALGIRIQRAKSVTDVYLNLQADGRRMHVNSNNTIAGWETDAYLLAWTRPTADSDDPAAVIRFFVACGSYLRRSGKVYLDSLSKRSLAWLLRA